MIPNFLDWMKQKNENMMMQQQMPQQQQQMTPQMRQPMQQNMQASAPNSPDMNKIQQDLNKEFMDKVAVHKKMAHARHCKKMKAHMRKMMGIK